MASKKGGLGRGLDALLGASRSLSSAVAAGVAAERADGELRSISIDLLDRGRWQPRQDMHQESLQELADSIRAQGVVQPIVVRAIAGGRYEIIAGERRWRAAQLAGLHQLPAVVRDVPDQAAVAIALIENIQREGLNPLEEASALRRLIDEFDLTHQAAAEAVGRSRVAVSNLLRLLDLADEVQEMLRSARLEMGHARALLSLPAPLQIEAARQVALRGLSVRETEALVRRLAGAEKIPAKPASTENPDVRRLQDELGARLGARVQLRQSDAGKGQLVIHYNNLDELDGILGHIR